MIFRIRDIACSILQYIAGRELIRSRRVCKRWKEVIAHVPAVWDYVVVDPPASDFPRFIREKDTQYTFSNFPPRVLRPLMDYRQDMLRHVAMFLPSVTIFRGTHQADLPEFSQLRKLQVLDLQNDSADDLTLSQSVTKLLCSTVPAMLESSTQLISLTISNFAPEMKLFLSTFSNLTHLNICMPFDSTDEYLTQLKKLKAFTMAELPAWISPAVFPQLECLYLLPNTPLTIIQEDIDNLSRFPRLWKLSMQRYNTLAHFHLTALTKLTDLELIAPCDDFELSSSFNLSQLTSILFHPRLEKERRDFFFIPCATPELKKFILPDPPDDAKIWPRGFKSVYADEQVLKNRPLARKIEELVLVRYGFSSGDRSAFKRLSSLEYLTIPGTVLTPEIILLLKPLAKKLRRLRVKQFASPLVALRAAAMKHLPNTHIVAMELGESPNQFPRRNLVSKRNLEVELEKEEERDGNELRLPEDEAKADEEDCAEEEIDDDSPEEEEDEEEEKWK